MISKKYFSYKLQNVRIKDIFAVFSMIIALILLPFYKKSLRNTWLICESPNEARDNGYQFFKYIKTKHPNQQVCYAIKHKSPDYKRVEDFGNIIEYGSIKHWLLYFSCKYNISSQKGGKPNAAICAFFELNGIFKVKNIFLQHGVVINNLEWLYAKNSKIDLFITSTIDETLFINSNFGYPKNTIKLIGLSRFDELHNLNVVKNRVLIMPTWRQWFNINSIKNSAEIDCNVGTSTYLNKWIELLNSPLMTDLIRNQNLEIIFYPHRQMQFFIDKFQNVKNDIIIASWRDYNIQDLLKSSAIMITDYSSVFFDMVYMKKPVIFYQFDEDEFRRYQYSKGYFDYHNNPFGNTFSTSNEVLKELKIYAKNKFKISEDFIKEHSRIFPFHDNRNSERLYNILTK